MELFLIQIIEEKFDQRIGYSKDKMIRKKYDKQFSHLSNNNLCAWKWL